MPDSWSGSGATSFESSASWSSRWAASTTWSAAVDEFAPAPRRTLADPGRPPGPGIQGDAARRRRGRPHVLVVGHPFVDIWQCVRPKAMGIEAWPEVPRGEDWKAGICGRWVGESRRRLARVISAVDSFADLEPQLVGAVETALDALAPTGEEPTDEGVAMTG